MPKAETENRDLPIINQQESTGDAEECSQTCTESKKKKCQTRFEGCDIFCTHADIIKKVNEHMPDEEVLYDLAEFFKVFGDSTRIRILYVLFQSEMCVCDIAEILNMTQSAISHQLRVLKQMQLVRFRREGKTVFYSLSDGHIKTIINQGLEHIAE